MRLLLTLCLYFFLSTAYAKFPGTTNKDVEVGSMVFHGDVPIHITGHAHNLIDLMAFVREVSGIPDNGEKVHIYMVSFGDEEEHYPELLALQRTSLEKEGQTEDRLRPNTTAYHYDDTAIIRVNPLLFRMHTTDAFGHSSGGVLGVGFDYIGHELYHVVHDWKGVPGNEHHCIFLREHYGERLADFLSERHMAPKWFLNSIMSKAASFMRTSRKGVTVDFERTFEYVWIQMYRSIILMK